MYQQFSGEQQWRVTRPLEGNGRELPHPGVGAQRKGPRYTGNERLFGVYWSARGEEGYKQRKGHAEGLG